MNYYSLKTDDPTFQLAFFDIRTEWIDQKHKGDQVMSINKTLKIPTPFFLFGKVLYYSSKLHNKTKNEKKRNKSLTLGEKKMPQIFFTLLFSKQRETGAATSFCLVCWVIIKSVHGPGGKRVVHSWRLFVSFYLLRPLRALEKKKKKREFKFFIDALSL